MKPAPSAAVATPALLAVAAPAISGAAHRAGKAGAAGATVLLTLFEGFPGLADYTGHGSCKAGARNRFSREEAMTLTNSTTAKLIGLPHQTGKP